MKLNVISISFISVLDDRLHFPIYLIHLLQTWLTLYYIYPQVNIYLVINLF